MSDRKSEPGDPPGAEEAFVQRWSRRKARARDEAGEPQAVAQPPSPEPPAQAAAAEATPPPELPDIDSLDGDSDYSAFLAEGVDAALRQRALRKLFHSPKFNVLDGLDDYMGDYTKFEGLGGTVTADLRHQLERAARRAADELVKDDRSKATEPAVAAAADEQPAEANTGDSDDGHDRTA